MEDITESKLGIQLSWLIAEKFPQLREVRDSMATLAQEEALRIQLVYRKAREEYQKDFKRGKAWVHDVRIKNIVSGAHIEWFAYKGRYGDQCYSEGIRSEGLLRIPASKFKSCSAAESKAIKEAENAFSEVRKFCRQVSGLSDTINNIPQMRLLDVRSSERLPHKTYEEYFVCDCEEPCTSCLESSSIANNHYCI